MSRSYLFCFVFFKCLTATISLTCTLANMYPSSNEISKKNCARGFIACDAFLWILIVRGTQDCL